MFGPLALKGRELFGGDVVCRGNGVSQAPSHVDKQHGLENGPHGQNHALLYNFWASYRLCAHLVYKGVGTSCGVTLVPTLELRHVKYSSGLRILSEPVLPGKLQDKSIAFFLLKLPHFGI